MKRRFCGLLLCLPVLAGCAAEEATATSLKSVTFAKELNKSFEAVDPTTQFYPDVEKIWMSVIIDGRPKKGVVKVTFRLKDQEITSVSHDLADTNAGTIISAGQTTNIGFSLTPNNPFPISDQYRADVYLNDEKIKSYSFEIIPPKDAISSKITESVLAHGATKGAKPIAPAKKFGVADEVFLVAQGDFGKQTSLRATWTIAGKVDNAATRIFTSSKNQTKVGYAFSFIPKGGWPKGEHKVTLHMNDKEIATHEFTIE